MKWELETVKVFTGKGDLPVVAAIYRRLFELVAPMVKDANFVGFGWGLKQGFRVLIHQILSQFWNVILKT